MRTPFLLSILCCGFCITNPLFATHNKSGEITFRKTGPLTVETRIITFTRLQSFAADRDTLTIDWGDGILETVPRINGVDGAGEAITPEIKYNVYIGTHTYAMAGVYTIGMTDPNRNAGIINVNPPQSENVPFHLQALVDFTADAALSLNSPVLLEIPIDGAVIGQPFVHVPGAYDPDGDSLAFELVTPMQALDLPVPNYYLPTAIAPGPANQMSLDPFTGTLVWDAPQIAGEYVVTILVKAYRDGHLVETVLRDMQIIVQDGSNHPPMIVFDGPYDQIQEVTPGDTIVVTASVSDPDAGQSVTLTSSSGLYGYFTPSAVFVPYPGGGAFQWVVLPEQMRDQPYAVVFKASDDSGGLISNGTPDHDAGHGLASFKVIQFRVRQIVATADPSSAVGRLIIYPNPATDAVTVRWPVPATEGMRLRMVDVDGRLLHDIAVPPGAVQQRVALTAVPASACQLQLYSAGGVAWSGMVLRQ